MNQQIIIATDHAGFELKNKLVAHLSHRGYKITDVGTNSAKSMDYPDAIHQAASKVNEGIFDRGIILCGSGNGASITANKYIGVRSALCWNIELVQLARQHNDANILCLPARFIDESIGIKMAEIFLNTSFEGGRHQIRIDKIKNLI